MQVTVLPPTQIVSLPSRETCTRPARPSAVPWLATYGAVTRPVLSNHSASDAFKLPVTGSSIVEPSFGMNARTEGARRALGIRADGSQIEVHDARAERQHRIRAREQDRHPPGAVVDPLGVLDLAAIDVQHRREVVHQLVLHLTGPDQRRRRKCEALLRPANVDQPRLALLDDDVALPGRPARREPGVARPERWMAGEGKLVGRREDPDAVVRVLRGRRQHEGRLGEVDPVGDPLHPLRLEARRIEHDGDRVARVRAAGEHIDLAERAPHLGESTTDRRWQSPVRLAYSPGVLELPEGPPAVGG